MKEGKIKMFRIAIEGGEGAGKTTFIKALKKLFNDQFNYVQEPGSTSIGLKERQYILENPELSESEKAKHFAIARKSVNHELVIDSTKSVIFDRSIISSLVYQTESGELTRQDIIKINKAVDYDFAFPDVVVFLDIDPEFAMNRIHKNNRETNYLDDQPIEQMNHIRSKFLEELQLPSTVGSSKVQYVLDSKLFSELDDLQQQQQMHAIFDKYII